MKKEKLYLRDFQSCDSNNLMENNKKNFIFTSGNLFRSFEIIFMRETAVKVECSS